MLTQINSILQSDCQLDSQQSVLVGVSGGADSLCLLDMMNQLDYPIIVAHLDHGIRPQSPLDARTVERFAGQLGLPFISERINTPAHAQKFNLSLEEAAREVRYRFLFGQAERHNAQAVAVAHNADDQVETLLMHLLRGSGLDGLTGMPHRAHPNPWSVNIPLIRPLLGIWRTEIEAYCHERGLKPVFDHTNRDTKYFRNRLRHQLIPDLETYVPKVRQRLHQTANLLAADRKFLEEFVDQTWDTVLTDIGAGFLAFNLHTFNRQPLALKRRLARKALSQLRPGARDMDFAMIQRVLDFAVNPTVTHQTDIGLGLYAFVESESITLAAYEADLLTTHWPQLAEDCSPNTDYWLPNSQTPTTNIALGNGWHFELEISSDPAKALNAARLNADSYQAWIDFGDQQPNLNIRTRCPGDRFQPLGMESGSMKLSDFMINVKIPKRARDSWPLICLGGEIVWVPGYRLAHPFRIVGESTNILKLKLSRPNP